MYHSKKIRLTGYFYIYIYIFFLNMLIVYKVKYYMCLYTFKSAYLLNKRVKSIKKINIYNNYLNIYMFKVHK